MPSAKDNRSGESGGEEGSRSTRERILDAALDLFIEKGYDKASLRELAEQLGFTKAALYYHFRSKADILVALHSRMHALMDGPFAILDEGPLSKARFEKFLFAAIDEAIANRKLFDLHRINQAALSEIHNVQPEGHEGAHDEMEERFRKLFSDETLTGPERLRMMGAFGVAFFTSVMSGQLQGVDVDDAKFAKDLKQIVRRVLGSR